MTVCRYGSVPTRVVGWSSRSDHDHKMRLIALNSARKDGQCWVQQLTELLGRSPDQLLSMGTGWEDVSVWFEGPLYILASASAGTTIEAPERISEEFIQYVQDSLWKRLGLKCQ